MIGILGGAFDPIHIGHLRTALEVKEQLGLTELRLIPTHDPPHRPPLAAPGAIRLEMVRAAIAGQPGFVADDRELRRTGKSYTLLTLRELREELGDPPLCLLLGADAFRGFPTWHQPEEVLDACHLIVMQRPGDPAPPLYTERHATDPAALASARGGKILFMPVTQLAISATQIRGLARDGRDLRYLVPEAVLAVIRREGLYRG